MMSKKTNGLKNIFKISLCCLLPWIVVMLLPILLKINPVIGNIISLIVPFICPLIMIGMMASMSKIFHQKECCSSKELE